MKQHTVMTPYMVGEVHFYSTEIEGELVLFDTGPPTAEALAHLERSLDVKRLKHVFISHCHVDHYGLAAYIQERSDARVYFPRYDVLRLRNLDQWMSGLRSLLVEGGFDDAFCSDLLKIFQSPEGLPPNPKKFEIAEEAEAIQRLGMSVVHCPGHSQSDLVYVSGGFAVTGDIMLRDIFQSPLLAPDVTDLSRRFSNYHAYCSTIPKLATLKGLTVLPAHRESIDGVDGIILFYVRKLMERAGQVKRFSGLEKISEVVDQIFGGVHEDPVIAYIKASELYFMRDFLEDPLPLKLALIEVGLYDQVRELYEAVAG